MDLRPLDDRWLPVPDVAAILGTSARDVRNLIRSQHLLACRIEGLEGGRIPSAFLDRDGIVDGLRGSIIQLTDSGMTADQAIAWLLSPNDELGCTPVAALHAGRKHAVRRAALGEAL
ncbi:MAG: DNA-binding protein [Actinomycetes bacterium]|nr:DNA-binding protein [Actinomycetes bacterium]MDX5380891.1 DNA-binding protein [Actinomycetes bacterium]MDX5399975.1 DNA-binding protein [Actinomycetes bacterium]MDX5450642.1 DNA-binding protein [Actinomycetes bacterium]